MPVHVEPLVFDLLRLFVENCGAVVDRDRMLAEVWDGRFVSEATLSTAVKSARRALGDSGEAQTWIETVRGRGFRFKGAVSVEVPARPAAAAGAPAEEPRRRRRAARPRSRCCRSCGSATPAPSRGSRTRCRTR